VGGCVWARAQPGPPRGPRAAGVCCERVASDVDAICRGKGDACTCIEAGAIDRLKGGWRQWVVVMSSLNASVGVW